MKNVKKLLGFAVVFMVVIVGLCSVSFAATEKYLIVDVFDHYGTETSIYAENNCAAIHELELLDSNGRRINYTISATDAYDSNTNGLPNYWNQTGLWDKTNLADLNYTYSAETTTIVTHASIPNSQKWARFVLSIDSSKVVSKINVWAGQVRIPKKVTVYEAASYNYNTNIKNRDNTGLNLFGECTIQNSTSIIANVIAKSVPQAPTNLTVVSAGNKEIKLKWDSVEGATSYNIKRSTASGKEVLSENYPVTTTAAAVTYTDIKNLDNGTTYYYVVTAVNANGESAPSNEVSATPKNPAVTLEVTSVDKAKVRDLITANVVIHNATNICAEDIKLAFDTTRLEFVSAEGANGIKIYKEADIAAGIKRYITASLGKANAANGDKILLKLTFKAKAIGEAKIDITNGRIADNATLEMDVEEANCGEKTVLIEGIKDVNRSGEFTLLDLGIDAWYYGDAVVNTDTSKYDTDVVENGTIDDADLSKIVEEMLNNPNYPAPKV